MYSQNNEEQIIIDYFSEKIGKFSELIDGMNDSRIFLKGKFMDIGGYDPFKFSNTRKLYELGWSGIYIEPSPICFANFVKEYAYEPRIELIQKAVVASDEKEITLYEANGDAVSTTSVGHRDRWSKAGAKYAPKIVTAIHVRDLLLQYKGQINLLSIDVEATNYDLFQSIPIDFLETLDMLCIEHDNWHQAIQNKMEGLGFKKLLHNAENIILAR